MGFVHGRKTKEKAETGIIVCDLSSSTWTVDHFKQYFCKFPLVLICYLLSTDFLTQLCQQLFLLHLYVFCLILPSNSCYHQTDNQTDG